MAVVTVESAMENVLEEAGALPRHCRIALNRLKVTIRTVAEEDLDLPLTLGIVGVAVRIDFCSEIVNSGAFAFGVLCLLQIEQRRSCHRGTRFQQHLFGCLIQVQDRASALTDDLEMVTVVASIKREIETPGAGIAKQIRVLVALVRDAVYQHLFLINMKPVARTRQNDVAARCVVIPRDGEVQKTFILGIRFGQDRGPARVGP